ncbi:hypothetical protein [Diaphorobacter aerolatus]|uniref:hypothetical protein n=1 Tax=Diaphorobacter aerolatus TaxID=1288495 RepID=UPI001D025397|nr:hypothetical protein [Diaphorobacter aerolatus]
MGDTQETWGRSGSPPMPGGRRLPIPPFWIYVAVLVAIGAFFFGWLMAIPPLVTLALLGFALHRVLKHFGGLGGPGRPRPPQRK